MASIESILPRDGNAVVRYAGERLRQRSRVRQSHPRSSVTLSYAQSLDGSIAIERGKPLQLSNPHTQALTHRLRALHDAVLVGINTVLSDDPQLTVRLAPGNSPRPVVLDSQLRFPLSARLLNPPCIPPLIVTTATASPQREGRLREAGAQIIRLPALRNGHVDVGVLLTRLHTLGIASLMVEGGSTVITSFLASENVDVLIVTIVPRVLGGLPAVTSLGGAARSLPDGGLTNVHYHSFAGDLVVCAEFADADGERKNGSKPANAGVELAAGPLE